MKDLAIEVTEGAGVLEDVKAKVNDQEATGIDFLIKEIEGYTNYDMVTTMWSWEADAVQPGESVGVCMKPNTTTDAYASCWMYQTDLYGAYGPANSYLLASDSFVAGARLEEMPALEAYPIPGMKGSWMCQEPMELFGRVRTMCSRFAPKIYTAQDPSFAVEDDITVMTYLSSRYTGRDQMAMGTSVTEVQGFTEGNKAFEKFNMNLKKVFNDGIEGLERFMGAMTGVSAASAAVLTVAAASMAF